MPKKGELSKTARASMANREVVSLLTDRVCAACGERILSSQMYPVQVLRDGKKQIVHYHKDHYKLQ